MTQTSRMAARIAERHAISVTEATKILSWIAGELETYAPMEHWSGWDTAVAQLRAEATAGLLEPLDPEPAVTWQLFATVIGLVALFAALLVFTI